MEIEIKQKQARDYGVAWTRVGTDRVGAWRELDRRDAGLHA